MTHQDNKAALALRLGVKRPLSKQDVPIRGVRFWSGTQWRVIEKMEYNCDDLLFAYALSSRFGSSINLQDSSVQIEIRQHYAENWHPCCTPIGTFVWCYANCISMEVM